MMNLSIQLLINHRDRVYLSRLSNEEEVDTSPPPPPPPPSLLDEQPPSQLAQSGEEGNDDDDDEEEEYEDNGILDYDEELPLNSTSPSKMMHEQRYV